MSDTAGETNYGGIMSAAASNQETQEEKKCLKYNGKQPYRVSEIDASNNTIRNMTSSSPASKSRKMSVSSVSAIGHSLSQGYSFF